MTKESSIHIRISPELKRTAEEMARKDGRTLSGFICHMIESESRRTAGDAQISEKVV